MRNYDEKATRIFENTPIEMYGVVALDMADSIEIKTLSNGIKKFTLLNDKGEIVIEYHGVIDDAIKLFYIGRAAFGRSWQAQLADYLKVDRRRIVHWIKGTRPVPAGVWVDLKLMLDDRAAEIDKAREFLY